jgi:enoyl-CoA hydratase/carnithine racemase
MSDPLADAVLYEVDDAVATITLNRPDSKNRLDASGMAALAECFARAAADDAVRVVVLTGSGNTFCSGADMSAAVSKDAAGFTGSGPAALVAVLTAMLDLPKPIIAKVQGHVAGGGNGLVAAADIAIASSDARFAFSEVRIGVAPAVISVVCLQVMNRRSAQELFLTGERVDADRVLEAGLLTSVCPPDALAAVVASRVEQLLAGGPSALASAKDLLRRIPSLPLPDAFDEAASMSAALFASPEAQEGMSAFLGKRAPNWA